MVADSYLPPERREALKRLLVAVGLLAASLLFVRLLAVRILTALDERNGLGTDLSGQLAQLFIASASVVLPLFAVYWIFLSLGWCRVYRPTSVSVRLAVSGFLWLFIPLLLLIISLVGIGSIRLIDLEPNFGRLTALWAVLVVAETFLSALLEEVVFRGLLIEQMRALGAHSALAVAASAIVFGLCHYNDDAYQLWERTVIGIGLGWSAVRLASIGFPFGAHFGMNLGVTLLSPGFGANPITGSHSLTSSGGETSGNWQGGLVFCVLIVVACEVVRLRSRRRAIRQSGASQNYEAPLA